MKKTIGLAVAVMVANTALYAQNVNVDSDPAAPFATYKSYAWTQGTPAPNPLNDQRLRAGVEARLSARGLAMNSTAPDLIVATHVTTSERRELIASGFGWGPWYGGGGTATVETYTEGTLVVDLYDARTKKMVWRGVATATASDKPTKNAEKLDKALTKMFEKLPIGTPVRNSAR